MKEAVLFKIDGGGFRINSKIMKNVKKRKNGSEYVDYKPFGRFNVVRKKGKAVVLAAGVGSTKQWD